MKVSTKGRYALRMMLDLAQHYEEGFISLKDISKRQEISKKYLEQIIIIINKPDFLKTNRGSQGGYKLAKSPSEYTVGDILRLTEGSLSPVDCVDNPSECERYAGCLTLPVWKHLSEIINDYLDSVTLQDILDTQQEEYAINYVI
ncbi:MAG: RrF2 family transcriptional regulator [Clostridiales bacterium]|nr:RrF2 family transcriptional regulator [Clostridiales bacterium]